MQALHLVDTLDPFRLEADKTLYYNDFLLTRGGHFHWNWIENVLRNKDKAPIRFKWSSIADWDDDPSTSYELIMKAPPAQVAFYRVNNALAKFKIDNDKLIETSENELCFDLTNEWQLNIALDLLDQIEHGYPGISKEIRARYKTN